MGMTSSTFEVKQRTDEAVAHGFVCRRNTAFPHEEKPHEVPGEENTRLWEKAWPGQTLLCNDKFTISLLKCFCLLRRFSCSKECVQPNRVQTVTLWSSIKNRLTTAMSVTDLRSAASLIFFRLLAHLSGEGGCGYVLHGPGPGQVPHPHGGGGARGARLRPAPRDAAADAAAPDRGRQVRSGGHAVWTWQTT